MDSLITKKKPLSRNPDTLCKRIERARNKRKQTCTPRGEKSAADAEKAQTSGKAPMEFEV